MINKLKPKSEFTKNVLTLMTGTTIAQAIPIAISPILTRIYTPEDFGVFALFIAITAILGTIANARYELAIMLPKKDEDAINIFALGFIITCFMTFITLILVVVLNDYFINLLGNKEIGFWLYFVPLALFFSGLYNVLNYFNNRKKNYKDLRNATILKSIVLAIVQLSVGFVKSGSSGLISGSLLSNMFANMKLVRNILKDKILVSKIKIVKMVVLAKKYKDFPKFSFPTALLDVASLQAPIYIIGKYFSFATLGYYSLAYRVIQMPMGLVGGAFAQVAYQKISELSNRPKEQLSFIFGVWKKLFLMGIVPFGLIFIFAEQLFGFVFGENWIEAGKIASILAPMVFAMFISSPTSSAFIVLKMQNIGLYISVVTLLYRPLLLILGYYIDSFKIGLIFLVVMEILTIVVYNLIIIIKLKNKILLKEVNVEKNR